ncbi:MAG TPA: cytochrome c oxidase subunit 4 [Ktedonobacteraceae bacterium]|jgi:osmotically-inducible protein OsmY
MDSTLGTKLPADGINSSLSHTEEEQHHIHMPSPSFWPLLLSIAILIAVGGLLFMPDNPWLTIFGIPFILIGIIGWALEDTMGEKSTVISVQPAVSTGPMSRQVLGQARDAVSRVITVSSIAYSAHPIKVMLENDNTVLSLYGKVELEAQRQEIEDAVRSVPGVTTIQNHIVAEDEILNNAYRVIDNLRQKGKLEGASDISALVENYILSLYGQVPTTEMKYMLEKEMIGVPGVRVVINHIGLNEDIPGNLGRTLNKIGGV